MAFWREEGDGPYDSLCRKYVLASLLYYLHDLSPVPDSVFDNWALTLNVKYRETPQWFQERVSASDLRAGTGFALTPTPTEALLCDDFVSGRRIAEDYF